MRTSVVEVLACTALALALGGCPDHLDPIDCSLCADRAECTPGESYACECPAGFAGDGTAAGTGCVDVDECALATDDCAELATCTNTEGGFACACPDGFLGDGTASGSGCTCASGYEASGGACVDIDECARGTDDCLDADDGGTCTNTPGAWSCACDEDGDGDGRDPAAGGAGCTEKPTNPRLTIPRRMPNDKTLTVRADILDGAGKVDASGCFATLGAVRMTRIADGADVPITITRFDDHLEAPAGSIRFYHGIGSVSFTLDDGAAVPAGDYRVSVSVGALRASRVVHVLAAPTWREMPAVLEGANLVWGPHENIRITQHDTQVPAGKTLVIRPGTLVMVDTTGSLENGTLVTVDGKLDAAGTRARPIHVFSARGAAAMTHALSGSASNPDAWRGIYFHGNQTSTLKFVVLTGAGNGQIIRHPRPPILSFYDTHSAVIEDGVFVDSTGMMFSSPGNGTYTLRRDLVSRVGIGAEFLSSANTVRIEDTWWTGIGHGPSEPVRYDGDGVHVDGAASNQLIRGNVIADIGDDCIDQSNSTFTLEDSILHDCRDKGVSLTNGSITVRNSLVFNASAGIRGTARVANSTIATPSPIATVEALAESIVWPQSVATCTGTVGYSIVGDPADLGCGTGNQAVNPRFVDPGRCDFTPAPGSPALTAGPMGGRIGWRGFASW